MEAIAWFGAVIGVTMLLAGVGWAWWRHRAHLDDMQRRLAWNEQSRFELEQHTQELDLRLASMAQTLKSLETTRALDAALSRGDAKSAMRPRPVASWRDTEPMPVEANPYAETMPLELGSHDQPASAPTTGRPPVRP